MRESFPTQSHKYFWGCGWWLKTFGESLKDVEFESLMHKKFQMSSMGELTFFLGLQVMQRDDGIFISQDKSMIGSLMYLTASRPDIISIKAAIFQNFIAPLNLVVRLYRVKDQQSQLSPITHPLVLYPPHNHQLHHHLCKQPLLQKSLLLYPTPLPRVHSLGSDEGSMTLNKLIVLCTTLSKKVESLESDLKQTKQTYSAPYTKLIMRVKKLEHKVKSSKARRKVRLVILDDEDDLEDPSKQGRKIAYIDEDERITLVQMGAQTQWMSDEDLMHDTGVYDYPEGFTGPSTAEPVTTTGEGVSTARAIPEGVSTAGAEISTAGVSTVDASNDITLAETLMEIRKTKDKGKAIIEELKKPLKKKDQIHIDEELALRLHAKEQAKFERLQRVRAEQEEASRTTIMEEIDNIQAMIEADGLLAARV
ncbi:hypothetical protein Tco_0079002 [Tanacetum coccineum]